MEDYVLHDHYLVVDDETDSGCQSAQGHHVEAQAEDRYRNERDEDRYRHDQPCHECGTGEAPSGMRSGSASRRKSQMTKAANIRPMMIESRTLSVDSLTMSGCS